MSYVVTNKILCLGWFFMLMVYVAKYEDECYTIALVGLGKSYG